MPGEVEEALKTEPAWLPRLAGDLPPVGEGIAAGIAVVVAALVVERRPGMRSSWAPGQRPKAGQAPRLFPHRRLGLCRRRLCCCCYSSCLPPPQRQRCRRVQRGHQGLELLTWLITNY